MSVNFAALQNAGAHAQTLDFSKAQAVATGQRINFSKENPGVTAVRAELYWESDHDGDASVLILGANKLALPGVVAGQTDPNKTRGLVWYRNLSVPGITHTGDVRTANNDSSVPEETVKINLAQLDRDADEVVIIASTFPDDDAGRGAPVPFGRLRNCKVMVINDVTQEVLYVYELDEDFHQFTSVELASFYQRNGDWNFKSMGCGVGKAAQALSDIAAKYKLG